MIQRLRWMLIIIVLINNVFAAEKPAIPQQPTPQSVHFLTIGDIHFDPFTNCGLARPCEIITKLVQSPSVQWARIFEESNAKPSQVGQDTNYPLLNSALTASKQASSAAQTQFVIVLGDSLGHNFRSLYKKYSGDKSSSGFQRFVHKTLEFITAQLQVAYPNQTIFMVVGNNDSYQGDYVTSVDGAFFRDTSYLWSSLIRDSQQRIAMQKQFLHAGYYSLNLSAQPNLKLIVLNTSLFSYKGKGKGLNRYALEQLNWLHQELQVAMKEKQTVLIAMHIPEGIDINATQSLRLFRVASLWQQAFIDRFESEIENAAPAIMAIYAGHLHSEWSQLLTFPNGSIPLKGVTSISPIFGNNPGFEIDTYSTRPVHLDNSIAYIYPLRGEKTWIKQSAREYQ